MTVARNLQISRFENFFRVKGIHHLVSCPHMPSHNGRIERKHRHITETGLAMLFHAHLPPPIWVEAFTAAVYTISRLPSSILKGVSPFEALFGTTPNYENFHPFIVVFILVYEIMP